MATNKTELKTVVITGGGSGIGFETAKLLLDTKAYRLVLLGRNKAKLEEAAQTLMAPHQSSELGKDVVQTYPCDLGQMDQVTRAIDRITASGRTALYGLVNNAGIYPFGGLADTTSTAWDEAMNVNLKAPFLLTQAVAANMIKHRSGGRIVNVSSTAGLLPNHFALAYSVSKAALIQLTKTLAKELGKDGITVNCVCPGIVRTPLHDAYHSNSSELESFYAKRGSAFPLGRVGEPQDIAGAIRFFLGEDAAWVTGDILVVDGGRLLL